MMEVLSFAILARIVHGFKLYISLTNYKQLYQGHIQDWYSGGMRQDGSWQEDGYEGMLIGVYYRYIIEKTV